jgi:hypothetical protein
MSESGRDVQNEDFFGDFHAANGSTVPQIDNISDQNHPNSNETTTKEETATQPELQNNTEQITASMTNGTTTDAPSADFFNVDFSSPTNTQPADSSHFDFSEIKFPNGSLPATSDLLDINFGNLPVEPTSPGTPSIEVHFVTSDQGSEVSNETKSDTDSNAPNDSWSVSTQYPESRADLESVKDDAKSEQSLDDKSQVAEDGSDAFDFPTPKESGTSEQKDDAPVNMTDSTEFDFPAPEQPVQENNEVPKPEEPNGADVLLAPLQPSEDKPSEVQDDTISVTSDTVPANNTNDFTFEEELKSAPVVSDDSGQSNNGSEAKSGNSSLEQSTNEERDKDQTDVLIAEKEIVPEATTVQPTAEFTGSVLVETSTNASTSIDFDFPAPTGYESQQVEQNKSDEPERQPEVVPNNFTFEETPAPSDNTTNDFTFDSEFTSVTSSEDKQPEEPVQPKPADEPTQVKSGNDFEFEGEFTSDPAPSTTEEKQPEHVEEDKQVEASPIKADVDGTENVQPTQPEQKNNNDFEFEGEFTSTSSVPVPSATEEKQPEHVEENKSVAEPSPVKPDNDFEFEGEFTSAPSVPAGANNNETETSQPEEKKSDNDFEFEGEFTSAPTPSVPNVTSTNTNTNQDDDDDFFDSDFQAAPTVPQVPQEQPQAPKSDGTFEADFDEDFEGFAQAPTTPQPPVQPPQPVSAQTSWLFEGNETEVRDRVQTLVSTLFAAPAPSKVLPDINTTVEEKLEELRSSAPAVDTQSVTLPAPSVFAEHLKTLLASVPRPNRAPQPLSPASNLRELVLNDPRLTPIYRKKRF